MDGGMESLVIEDMDTDVKRKSISRELRKAEGRKDKEGRLLMKKKVMGRASTIIGLQSVEQRHNTCFLKNGYERDLNSVDNEGEGNQQHFIFREGYKVLSYD